MRWRFLLFLNALLVVFLVFSHVRAHSMPEEDGVVWIERRRRFLGREYLPGERVGRYTFSYVSKLKHE